MGEVEGAAPHKEGACRRRKWPFDRFDLLSRERQPRREADEVGEDALRHAGPDGGNWEDVAEGQRAAQAPF